MKRVILAISLAILATNANANPKFERWGSWYIRTTIDSFDNSKSVVALLWPKSGQTKRIAFVISCIGGQVVIGLSNKRGKITSNKIGFRQHLSGEPAIFREWYVSGSNLVAIDNEETVRTLSIASGISEYLVRVERNGSNETLNFELGTIDGPYGKVKDSCQKDS